jgi:hypothetical protein
MEAPDRDEAKVGCVLLVCLCLFAWLLVIKLMGWL